MSDYRKSKQHIEGVQNQKNKTEARCANQRKQLALMNAQIKNYKQLLKECQHYIVNTPVYPQGDDNKQAEIHKLVDKIINAIGEK